jgi:hypothetical protein
MKELKEMKDLKEKKAYCLGKSIILPHVRYINHGSKNTMMMFHTYVVKANGKHKTLGCDKTDDSGFCLGHEMSRKEFLERFCGELDKRAK